MSVRPSREPAKNTAEKQAKLDEYYSRKTGTAKSEQERAAKTARRLERKHGLKGRK